MVTAHTNGMESSWSMLKRAHKRTFHKLSPKHLQRYIDEFRVQAQLAWLAYPAVDDCSRSRDVGRRLTYARLIADNGLASGARRIR